MAQYAAMMMPQQLQHQHPWANTSGHPIDGRPDVDPKRTPPQHPQQPLQHQQQQPPVMHVVGDVKPRLTKEQHDILEAHFQQQHKPTTQTKKGFAETLGVPLDKINNWFQNRRAKVKQDAKKALHARAMRDQLVQMQGNAALAGQHAEYFASQPHLQQTAYYVDASGQTHAYAMTPEQASAQQHQQQQQHLMMYGPVSESSPDGSVPSYAAPGYVGVDFNGVPVNDPSHDFSFEQYNMTSVQDFGMYGDASGESGEYTFGPGAPMQTTQSNGSTPSIPSTLSSVPTTSTVPSSIGNMQVAAYGVAEWAEEGKHHMAYPDSSDLGHPVQVPFSSPEEGNSISWVQPMTTFEQSVSPEDLQRPDSAKPMPQTPPEIQQRSVSELELPNGGLIRRASSTHDLTETMGNVDIQTSSPGSEGGFKQPGEPSSLAARRQRPRPAALGQASLRSASYSPGMPVSPGSNPAHFVAPDQQLRRIRSSGLGGIQTGRIQKPINGSGQRSPLNMSFKDAAASPKFARHASAYAAVSSPGAHLSLAPPTPLTPSERARFPSWQARVPEQQQQQAPAHQTPVESLASPNGIALSWTSESPAPFVAQHPPVSSPPETPLDALHAAQYAEYVHAAAHHSFYRDTPPQSAPAHQQSFFSGGHPVIHEPQHNGSLSVDTAHLAHIRRPSLPENGKAMMQQMHMHAPPPNFHDAEMQQRYLYDASQQQSSVTVPSQSILSFPAPPTHAVSPVPLHVGQQSSVLAADFAVHEYTPPSGQQGQSAGSEKGSSSPTTEREGSAGASVQPKVFHFSHTGPKDYAASS